MRVKIPRWEIAVIRSALLFPGTSLSAQEVGQEEKEVKEMRQDVEQLQQDVRQLREEVRRLQEEIHGFRHNSFPQCGADTVAPYVPHHFIHRLGIYGGAYQGFGLAFTTFGDKKQLGDPMTFYVFQGARIARFNPRLSLNYEWNFGISAGWKPYDNDYNSYNGAVGSRVNAYLNAGIYLNWSLSRYFDFIIGGDFTHFSNGNTKFPNAGVNTTGAKIGLVYNFNREEADLTKSLVHPYVPRFPRHVSYDLVLFGSWRRKGGYVGEKQIASPGSYPVAGFNFAPMYNLNYKLRFGVSLDGVYDGSANVYTEDALVEYDAGSGSSRRKFLVPGIQNQLALGLSGRAEYVMPFFTIGVGLGTNVLGRGDLRGLYQVFALKINVTRSSFLHIGYNLQDFQTPNYLMLGLGFRFNNKYPKVRH